MGNDFIQKTKRSFRKGLDRERWRLTLAEPGLFGTSRKRRTLSCVPFDLSHFGEGMKFELNLENGRIFLYSNRVSVGVCKEPPQSILQELSTVGGKALGVFHKLREHSGMVEIAIALESESKAGVAS